MPQEGSAEARFLYSNVGVQPEQGDRAGENDVTAHTNQPRYASGHHSTDYTTFPVYEDQLSPEDVERMVREDEIHFRLELERWQERTRERKRRRREMLLSEAVYGQETLRRQEMHLSEERRRQEVMLSEERRRQDMLLSSTGYSEPLIPPPVKELYLPPLEADLMNAMGRNRNRDDVMGNNRTRGDAMGNNLTRGDAMGTNRTRGDEGREITLERMSTFDATEEENSNSRQTNHYLPRPFPSMGGYNAKGELNREMGYFPNLEQPSVTTSGELSSFPRHEQPPDDSGVRTHFRSSRGVPLTGDAVTRAMGGSAPSESMKPRNNDSETNSSDKTNRRQRISYSREQLLQLRNAGKATRSRTHALRILGLDLYQYVTGSYVDPISMTYYRPDRGTNTTSVYTDITPLPVLPPDAEPINSYDTDDGESVASNETEMTDLDDDDVDLSSFVVMDTPDEIPNGTSTSNPTTAVEEEIQRMQVPGESPQPNADSPPTRTSGWSDASDVVIVDTSDSSIEIIETKEPGEDKDRSESDINEDERLNVSLAEETMDNIEIIDAIDPNDSGDPYTLQLLFTVYDPYAARARSLPSQDSSITEEMVNEHLHQLEHMSMEGRISEAREIMRTDPRTNIRNSADFVEILSYAEDTTGDLAVSDGGIETLQRENGVENAGGAERSSAMENDVSEEGPSILNEAIEDIEASESDTDLRDLDDEHLVNGERMALTYNKHVTSRNYSGVSCDACLKGNFRGRRYKCLICYDYDLCAVCYEGGATTTRHTTEHPMQCILTRNDFDLYYGEQALSVEQPQSFTCPYCGKMGYTETTLQEHVSSDHADSSTEVVCPVCAAQPGGDPNHVTDDFAAHLTLEHRTPRDFEEAVPVGSIRHVRRIPHPGRGVGATRARRTNMHFQGAGSALSGLSPSSRGEMDPIAELLSQLSSVRNRSAAQSVSSQLQQLEMQLQSTRQQLERLPRRPTDATKTAASNAAQSSLDYAAALASTATQAAITPSSSSNNSQYLLARCGEPELGELEKQTSEIERADRSMFVQELLLSTLAEGLRLEDSDSSQSSDLENELNFEPGRGDNSTRSTHVNRNMVKHVEANRKSEKEPPPFSPHS